jgi:hypothetical protein
MPEHDLTRYAKGKIYTIRSRTSDEVYYGSTCSPLHKRLYEHRMNYKYWLKNGKRYVTSYELIKDPTHYIELVKLYPCELKCELEREEGQLIRDNPCMNKHIPGRAKTEWYRDNAEHVKAQQKQYREDNVEQIKVYMKQYNKDNAEQIKDQQKQYREANAENIKAQTKQYRRDNAEKIKLKAKAKYECPCGGKYTQSNRGRHLKSNPHREYTEFMALTEEQIIQMLGC